MASLGKRILLAMERSGMSRTELAKALNTTTMSIGNLVNDQVQKPRNLLEIANVLGVDPNWLQNGDDQSVINVGNTGGVYQSQLTHSDVQTTNSNVTNYYGKDVVVVDGDCIGGKNSVVLTAYHRLAGGDGYLNADYPDEIRSIEFSPEKFVELFGRKTAKNLALAVVDGNSMFDPADPAGSLKHGDYVCLDMSVTEFRSDGVYVFTFEGYEKIKRLQHLSGNRIKVISDNPRYEDEVISGSQLADFRIRGKLFKKIVFDLVDI